MTQNLKIPTDAGKILDAVVVLRRLMTAADSAAWALEELNSPLATQLSKDATSAQKLLEQLEATPAYQAIRQDYLT